MRLNVFCELALIAGLVGVSAGCTTSKLGSADHEHGASPGETTIELNHGKKWVMDAPMMVHIRKVEKAVQDFERSPGGDHQALARDINDNLGRLVTNCTMKGKAHDELHKWLLPFVGLSGEYSEATDAQVQAQKFKEIKQALLAFNDYFE